VGVFGADFLLPFAVGDMVLGTKMDVAVLKPIEVFRCWMKAKERRGLIKMKMSEIVVRLVILLLGHSKNNAYIITSI
jgi:hypothetical protein